MTNWPGPSGHSAQQQTNQVLTSTWKVSRYFLVGHLRALVRSFVCCTVGQHNHGGCCVCAESPAQLCGPEWSQGPTPELPPCLWEQAFLGQQQLRQWWFSEVFKPWRQQLAVEQEGMRSVHSCLHALHSLLFSDQVVMRLGCWLGVNFGLGARCANDTARF